MAYVCFFVVGGYFGMTWGAAGSLGYRGKLLWELFGEVLGTFWREAKAIKNKHANHKTVYMYVYTLLDG